MPQAGTASKTYPSSRYIASCAVCGAELHRWGSSRYNGATHLCGTSRARGGATGSPCRSYHRRGVWPSTPIPATHPVRSSPVPEHHPARQCQCPCGTTFARRWPGQRYCSRACAERKGIWPPRFRAGTCTYCGERYVADRYAFDNGTSTTCSDRCSRNAGKARRRALRRGAARHEAYSPIAIAERDRWRCHVCGKKVLKNVTAPHPKARSMDHLVPLSQHGDDTAANVRLAHFVCNSLRGNRGGGEQLAFL